MCWTQSYLCLSHCNQTPWWAIALPRLWKIKEMGNVRKKGYISIFYFDWCKEYQAESCNQFRKGGGEGLLSLENMLYDLTFCDSLGINISAPPEWSTCYILWSQYTPVEMSLCGWEREAKRRGSKKTNRTVKKRKKWKKWMKRKKTSWQNICVYWKFGRSLQLDCWKLAIGWEH